MRRFSILTALFLAGSMLTPVASAQEASARSTIEKLGSRGLERTVLNQDASRKAKLQAMRDRFKAKRKAAREARKKIRVTNVNPNEKLKARKPNEKLKARKKRNEQRRRELAKKVFKNPFASGSKKSRVKTAARPATKTVIRASRKLPKIESSKFLDYEVVKRVAVTIEPRKLELALADQQPVDNNSTFNDAEAITPTPPVSTAMMRDLEVAGKLLMRAEKHLAQAVSDHYSENQNYLWINEVGAWNARARSVIEVLSKAGEVGLDPNDYKLVQQADRKTETLSIGSEERSEQQKAAERVLREVSLSIAVLRYAMDAKYGRINPNLLSEYHDFPVHYAKAPELLEDISKRGLPANSMKQLHPTNVKFAALKNELAALSSQDETFIELPERVLIRPGTRHDALPLFVKAISRRGSPELVEAFGETLANHEGGTEYTPEIADLVKAFQREAGLGADGVIGPKTARKLAGESNASKRDRVVMAMERLRWLPHELGNRHVFINQPEYLARYVVDDTEELSMRVVVGKKENQTNFFYDEIEHVEYNPYWNVPNSIIVNEFLPKSVRNPGYLDASGYELATWSGKKLSSSGIKWSQIGTRPNFSVRQPPGPKNALGELKIMFPNKHAIYMHDTPAKALFNRENRAFSHGCVRLHDPQAMAAAVLGKNKKAVSSAIARGDNHTEKLNEKVPVYVAYFTAWPQQDGNVKYFADMYERDAYLMKAIRATSKARNQPLTAS